MRKIKLIAIVMSFASCLSLFSVGFSTWYNVAVPDKSISGDLAVYDVLNIENDGMEIFSFSMFSFKDVEIDSDGTIISLKDNADGVGELKVNYVVPAATLKATDGTFTVTTILGYDGLSPKAASQGFEGLFYSFCGETPANSLDVTATGGTTTSTTKNATKITNTFSFSGVSANSDDNKGNYEFTVIYKFTIASGENFRTTFGQYLMGTDGNNVTKFNAWAEINK